MRELPYKLELPYEYEYTISIPKASLEELSWKQLRLIIWIQAIPVIM